MRIESINSLIVLYLRRIAEAQRVAREWKPKEFGESVGIFELLKKEGAGE